MFCLFSSGFNVPPFLDVIVNFIKTRVRFAGSQFYQMDITSFIERLYDEYTEEIQAKDHVEGEAVVYHLYGRNDSGRSMVGYLLAKSLGFSVYSTYTHNDEADQLYLDADKNLLVMYTIDDTKEDYQDAFNEWMLNNECKPAVIVLKSTKKPLELFGLDNQRFIDYYTKKKVHDIEMEVALHN